MNDAEIRLKVDVDGDKASSALSKIGKVGAGIGKAVLAGTAVAGTALIGLIGKSVSMAGELEQQLGGTEAVFQDFAKGEWLSVLDGTMQAVADDGKANFVSLQDVAKGAFSTMGISTNDYLATINKMGALMQGSGVKQETALNLSAQAMQRAADVASIMGVDVNFAMESIAGAAKGNYTMMDNLGVAMNDTALANYALEKGLTKTYSEMSKGEQVQLAMQMFLEKSAYATGNYAKENETFAGSLQTMKSAFTNFLSGAGTVDDLIKSVLSFGKILISKIVEMAPKIVSGIATLIKAVIPELVKLISSALPIILKEIPKIFMMIVELIPTLLPMIIQMAVDLLVDLVKMLPTMLPILLDGLLKGFLLIITALAEAMPEMTPAIVDAILAIIPILIENLPLFIKAGMQLTAGIAIGLINAMPKLLEALPKISSSILGFFRKLPGMLLDIGKNSIYGLWEGIKNVTTWLYNKIEDFVKGALKKIKDFFGIKSPSKEFEIIGRYNVQGLEEGFEKEEKNLNRTISATLGSGLDLANKMGLGGNINSKIGSYSANGNMTIYVEQAPIELDGNRLSQAQLPYITKNIKLAGGNV